MRQIAILLGAATLAVATPGLAASGGGSSGQDTLARQASMLQPDDWIWQDDGGSGPLSVVVSLTDQRAYVYRGDRMIAVSGAATGRDGKETPVGVFTILQKQVKQEVANVHKHYRRDLVRYEQPLPERR